MINSMPQNKEAFRELCKENYLPLFMQPWWFDTVCGANNWDVVLHRDKKDKIIGAFPYYRYNKWGFNLIRMPEITPFNNVWLKYPSGMKQHSRYSFEREVMEALIEQLPNFAFFRQYFYYGFDNWLPFYWKGFKQTLHYSYALPDIGDPAALLRNMKGNARRNIQKAARQLKVSQENNPKEFFRLNQATFRRQGLPIPHDFGFFDQVNQVLQERGQGCMFFARDVQNRAHAAIYLVWDELMASVLFTGSDSSLRRSGAIYLLHWHAINEFSGRLTSYDFEGGMLPNVEPMYAAMGAIRQPIHIVYRSGNRLFSFLSWMLNRPYY